MGALTTEPQIARLPGFAFHAIGILEIEKRHVDNIEPGGSGGVDDARAGVEQRLPGILTAQFGGHVDAAEKQRVDARAAMSNFVGRLQPFIGFDDDMQATVMITLAQKIVEQMTSSGVRTFGSISAGGGVSVARMA